MTDFKELSNELVRAILDFIAVESDRSIDIDKRASLSQESFKAPPRPAHDQVVDIANFRLVCKRFSNIGIPYQFGRVTTRFSIHGFRRLEAIAERAHLAQHVRKFSYMVPLFYAGGHYPRTNTNING